MRLCYSADVVGTNPEHQIHAQPARVLGFVDATCVVIGAIIGVGIFFTPSSIARLVDSPTMAMLAWGLGGLIALCGAVVYAELGGMYQESGAQYSILRDAYGRFTGFLFVFCNSTATEAGSIGVMAMICAMNVSDAFGIQPPSPMLNMAMAMLLIAGLSIANIVGVRWGARIQNVTVYIKLLTLLAVTALALVCAPRAAPVIEAVTAKDSASQPAKLLPIAALLAAMVPTLFSYGGWQQALWVAGEIRDPKRNLPRAIVIGVITVVATYLLVNWGLLRMLGLEGVRESSSVAADATAAALPNHANVARRCVTAAVAISALGVLNVQLLTAPRLIYALAHDGLFLRQFATVHARFRTPVFAIVLMTVLAMALLAAAGFNGVDKLITGVVFIDGIFLAMTGAALLVLRRSQTHISHGVRLPAATLAAIIFVLGEIGVLIGAYMERSLRIAAIVGVCWIIVAGLIYLIWLRRPAGVTAIDPRSRGI
jgi:basic amino acid/polyamine antiporter, APA family